MINFKESMNLIKSKIKKLDLKKIDFLGLIKNKYFAAVASVIVLTLVLGSALIKLSASKKYTITTNKAEEYFYMAEYDKAIKEYKSISDKDKENTPWWNLKIAEVYSVKGDHDSSTAYISKVKTANSTDVKVLNLMVFTEFMNKDYKIAETDGEKILNLHSKDKSLVKTMFIVYMANNDLAKAKTLIKQYNVDKKSAYDMAEYSRMLMLLGQWDDGLQALRTAWGLDRDEYKIYDTLSQIAVYNKDDLLQKVTALSTKNPEDIAYTMWLAKIYSQSQGTAAQAQKLIDGLKGKNAGKIEIKLIQASVYQNSGQAAKGDEMINKIITDNPDDYRVLHTAGWYYLNKNDIKKAEEYCKQSILKNKNYPDNYGFLMPEIMKAKGKSLEGEPYFRTALYLEPYNYNIMLNIANYYWYTAKNSDKALEYFKFAEIVKPDDAEIKYNMALIYINGSNNAEAINLLKQCIKINDMVPKYHRTLGTIYFLQKNTAGALKEIRYAYAGDENDIMTLNNAGCYYISVQANLDRGFYNLEMAHKGINKNTDEYTKKVVESNYSKAKQLMNSYKNGKPNSKIKVPEFTLFY